MGLHAAIHFFHMGAEVFLLQETSDSFDRDYCLEYPAPSLCSKLSIGSSLVELSSILARDYLMAEGVTFPKQDEFPTYKQYYSQYLMPLRKFMASRIKIKQGKLIRIDKTNLGLRDWNSSVSRMKDCFSLTYQVIPAVDELTPLASGQKLDQDVILNLQEGYETVEEVDVVVDARGPQLSLGLHPAGGNVMGQQQAYESGLIWSSDAIELEKLKGKKRLALVGTGMQSALTFLAIAEQGLLPSLEKVLFISSEEFPFAQIKIQSRDNQATMQVVRELDKLMSKLQEDYREDKRRAIEMNLSPAESKIEFLNGYKITGVNRLLKHSEIFLTLGPCQAEAKALSELKTLALDVAIITTGNRFDTAPLQGLKINFAAFQPFYPEISPIFPEEPGYYALGKRFSSYDLNYELAFPPLKFVLEQIQSIEDDLMNFFSRKTC